MTRLPPEDRRRQLLNVALELATNKGYQRFTREDLAEAAGCSGALIYAYYVTIQELRNTVMRAAIRRGVLPIIAQGLADRHTDALAAPRDLQMKAADWMVGRL